MTPPTRGREEVAFLLDSGRAAAAAGHGRFAHLDLPVGAWNYVRIADEIAARFGAGRILDWGCGFGQMSWLLGRRGFSVTSYDVGAPDAQLPDVPLCRAVSVVRTTHPTALPFPDGSFDVVLSCGVLEHVDEFSEPGNEAKSLAEIRRVLRPGGWFSIYQLPQHASWLEAVARTLRLGYSHPHRYTAAGIVEELTGAGYRVESLSRTGMLPRNVTGLPGFIRKPYGRLGRVVLAVDRMLSAIPVANRLAGVLELTARRN